MRETKPTAMRGAGMEPQPTGQAPAPADRPAAPPLEEITFDISAFLGDDQPAEQLLQNLLDAPPASVPVVLPQPAPAAAAGQSSSQTKPKPLVSRRQLERVRQLLLSVPVPPVSALPPGVTQMDAVNVLFKYAAAQRRTAIDDGIILHNLAKKNNTAELARYADLMIGFKHKTHVHTKNRHGETPLHVATGAGSARVLLERGAKLDALDKMGNTPIHLAARHQRVDVLQVLLEHSLLDQGPDYSLLDRKNFEGYTALHLVVIHQPLVDHHRRALTMLIDSGVDINIQDDTGGRSALFHAVLRGDEQAVRELVENEASVNLADFSETTPLQAAEDVLPAGNSHICSILLERGGFKVPPADRVTQTGRRGGGRKKAT